MSDTPASTRAPVPPLAVVGGGNMASAVLFGAAERGTVDLDRCVVAEPDPERRGRFPRHVASPQALMPAVLEHETTPGETALFLAVKPQKLAEVARELRPALLDDAGDRLVLSILAGVSSARVREALGGRVRVVRVMPNTPARVCCAMTAICAGAGARDGDEAPAEALFGAIGRTIRLEEELFDAYTAVAGSGPAYVFYLAEAMRAAAAELGIGSQDATAIVTQTLKGAAALLESSQESPEALRREVTSPGGVTAAVTDTFDERHVAQAISDGIRAGRNRARELGR